jgi:hypothetical protein
MLYLYIIPSLARPNALREAWTALYVTLPGVKQMLLLLLLQAVRQLKSSYFKNSALKEVPRAGVHH